MGAYWGWTSWDFDEERDLDEDSEVWVIDAKDCVPALYPFELWNHQNGAHRAMSYGSQTLCQPVGIPQSRTKDGFVYFTRIKLPAEERKRREPIFRERIAPWLEDFNGTWDKYRAELEEGFQRLKKAHLEKLTFPELREHFEDWLRYHRRSWDIHMLCMYAAFHVYTTFVDLCKELLGIDEQHPQFKALMAGFDNRIFQVDRGLWQLGGRAMELGLAPLFQTIEDDEKLLSELEQSEAGRKWLEELHQFLDENGWRTPRVFDVSSPTWVEKPSLALPTIRTAVAKGGPYILDQERERLAKQREEAEKDVLSRVPVDKREMFEKAMRSAQLVRVWAEGHLFYCEHYTNGLGRRVLKEIGTRFAQKGLIDEPQDIYFLLPEEISLRLTIADLGKFGAHKLVQIRKPQYQENLKTEPPFAIGDMSKLGELVSDELVLSSTIAGVPVVKPELKADLYGSHSAPGVGEGPARVIMSEREFHLVQPGEILVTVTTSPIWTPVFGIVKGVITDTGGSLTHAIIVGREYGLPVVAGTQEATRKIKTGQKIRVDGDNGCVYIIE